MDLHQYFEYKEKGKTITFKETNEDGLICYNCGKKYKKNNCPPEYQGKLQREYQHRTIED